MPGIMAPAWRDVDVPMSTALCETIESRVAFLSTPAAWPDHPTSVQVIETHFAYVFLTGAHAWKLKKPLAFGAIDYRTLESRERGCRSELHLNRRLAPGIYLDVVPLCRNACGTLQLGGDGRPVDWLVQMRELSAARMLDRALRAGEIPAAEIAAVTRHLCRFFQRAEPAPLDGPQYLERLARESRQELAELAAPEAGAPCAQLAELATLHRGCLDTFGEVLAARIAAGRVVDGHGDLRPEHVWLGPPVAVIDCLEFDADPRRLDSAEEIAFLTLECERAGAATLARKLTDAYRAYCHDAIAPPLFDFYRSRRALVRGRLAAWRLREPGCRDPTRWRDTMRAYLGLAVDAARRALEIR